MTSRSFITGTGLKKWVPMNLSGRFVTAAIAVMLTPEVLLKKRHSGFTMASSSWKTFFLTSSSSMMTSTTTSASAAASLRSSVGLMRPRIASMSAWVRLPFSTSRARFFLMVFMPPSMNLCSMSRMVTS